MAAAASGENRAGNTYIDMDGDVHWNGTTVYAEDANIVLGATTGTKIGTATTDLLGFYNATPVDQPSAYTQTYATGNKTIAAPTADTLTDSTGGTAATTLAAGVGISVMPFQIDLAGITDADVLTTWTPGYKFKIVALDFFVSVAATTAAKLTTLNAKIGVTATTGGAVALTSANCTPKGVKVAGSAITAANTGTAANTVSIVASATTAFAEGAGWILLTIQNMDTADAFASLVNEQAKSKADDLDVRQGLTSVIDDLQQLGLVG